MLPTTIQGNKTCCPLLEEGEKNVLPTPRGGWKNVLSTPNKGKNMFPTLKGGMCCPPLKKGQKHVAHSQRVKMWQGLISMWSLLLSLFLFSSSLLWCCLSSSNRCFFLLLHKADQYLCIYFSCIFTFHKSFSTIDNYVHHVCLTKLQNYEERAVFFFFFWSYIRYIWLKRRVYYQCVSLSCNRLDVAIHIYWNGEQHFFFFC